VIRPNRPLANPRRAVAVLAASAGLLLLSGAPADAHPLGNFTRNFYAGITISPDRIRIDHVTDLAEIPTFSERQGIDTNHDGTLDPTETRAYQDRACQQTAAQVHLSVGNHALALGVDSSSLSFPPGAGGLPTLRLECAISASLAGSVGAPTGTARLDDLNQNGRLGWHEITAIGDRVRLSAPGIPSVSASHRLTRYPADLLSSPLTQHIANLTWIVTGAGAGATTADRPASSAVSASPIAATRSFGSVDTATRAFTALIDRQHLTVPFALLALLLAVALGGLHALAPGHGKTIMAGYLVGAGARVREAVTIGLSVTITHTAGVILLGVLLVATARFAPETIYPWMTIASGLLAVTVGLTLLRITIRRTRNGSRPAQPVAAQPVTSQPVPVPVGAIAPHQNATQHHHAAGHEHSHHGLGHDQHGHGHTHLPPASGVGLKGLLTLGLAGGLVPSPSALVVLLAGFSLHRAWFGLLLVIAYGAGMALALTMIGMLLVRARGMIERVGRGHPATRRLAPVLALLPTLAALVVVIAGSYLITRGLAATRI
jgi:nickel/cobalt transporter (NicO) family protein